MKKINYLMLGFVIIILISACSKKTNNSEDVVLSGNQSEIIAILTPTSTPSPTPTPTPIPTVSEREKAEKLVAMAQDYIDNGGNASYTTDEFDYSASVNIPEISLNSFFKGDNDEYIMVNGMITQHTVDGVGAYYQLQMYYRYDGSLINPEDVYIKSDTENMLISNFEEIGSDIGLGYVFQSYGKRFFENDYDELVEIKNILDSEGKIRMRLSGAGTIDFTLSEENAQKIIDSINLFIEYLDSFK